MIKTSTNKSKKNIHIAFDLFVLGVPTKTGIYRVCDEILQRLIKHKNINIFATQNNDHYEMQSKLYLKEKKINLTWYNSNNNKQSHDIDVLFSPYFAPWEPWSSDYSILKVFIAYDLIAIKWPQLFEKNLANQIKEIYDSIDGEELIFSISQSTKNDLLSYRPDINPNRIIVMPLAAGDQFYPCIDKIKCSLVRKKYNIPDGVPYFLSLATLEIRKNLDHVINTFSHLLKKIPDSNVHLVLAGMRGWKLEALNTSLNKMGKNKRRIILTGFVDDEDLSALYSDALCFIYMSLYEGFGLPPLEAMSCRTPVITSNTSSLPEVLGDAGILLDPYDIDGLCNSMQSILTNSVLREKLANKCFERSKKFNWDNTVKIIFDSIKNDLDTRKKLSIITICYNEKYIEDTCRSIVNQTWKNFEWIVVDGGSDDSTIKKIEKYKKYINIFISEKDNGRYEAMNKGISCAKGEYLLFLHGGDYFSHDKVLECIFLYNPGPILEKHINLQFNADILYGEVIAKETGMMPWPIWTVGPQQFTLKYFMKHNLPHQATFINRKLFKKYGLYNTTYQFAADYEWFMRVLLLHEVSSAYIPIPISVYNFEGASSGEPGYHEPHSLETKKLYLLYKKLYYNKIKMNIVNQLKKIIKNNKKYFPKWFIRFLRLFKKYFINIENKWLK